MAICKFGHSTESLTRIYKEGEGLNGELLELDDIEDEDFDSASIVHRIRRISKTVRNDPEERRTFSGIPTHWLH